MNKFKLSAECITLLEDKLQELAGLFELNGYDGDADELFVDVVLNHIDGMICEFEGE